MSIVNVSSILLFIIFNSSLVDIIYPFQELPSQYLELCAFALATSVSKVDPVLPVAVILTKIVVAVDLDVDAVVLKVVVVEFEVENVVVVLLEVEKVVVVLLDVLKVVVVLLLVLRVTDVFLEVLLEVFLDVLRVTLP